jgi:hypothetical protein
MESTFYNLLRLLSSRVLYNYKEAFSKISLLDKVFFLLLF